MTESYSSPSPDTITIETKALAVGGQFVGRVTHAGDETLIGLTAFTPFAAPGETITAEITERKPRFLRTELIAVENSSPDRAAPACPYFTKCGGCDIQHLEYGAGIAAKHDMISGAFRAGGMADILPKIRAVVPSAPYGYRRSVTLHVAANGAVGYYQRRTNRLLPVTECPIAVPAIESILQAGFTFPKPAPTGASFIIEAGENGVFGTLFLKDAPNPGQTRAWVKTLLDVFVGGSLVYDGQGTPYGKPSVQHILGDGKPIYVAPGLFVQRNEAVNAQLVARVRAFAQEVGARTAYDLYSGAGNFSLALAEDGIGVTSVETEPELTKAGEMEATRRGLQNLAVFVNGEAEKFLPKRRENVDLIVVDPPRAGLGKIVADLPDAKAVALVSCDVASGVRDVKAIVARGYTVQAVIPHDMFAQTGQVELLTLMRKAA